MMYLFYMVFLYYNSTPIQRKFKFKSQLLVLIIEIIFMLGIWVSIHFFNYHPILILFQFSIPDIIIYQELLFIFIGQQPKNLHHLALSR